jgi:pyruvate dehydrogenase E2 component (dihydrolipoamide acetyltransferase)
MQQFKMPQLGETVLEATVTRWLKQPGDTVELDEPLVEVSTDKVDSEIPSPAVGALTRILVQEGETVLVGAVMAEIDGESESAPASNGSPANEAPPAPREAEPTPDRPAPSPSPKPARSPAPLSASSADGDGEAQPFRQVLSPLVRKLANEHGVDLATVSGSGTGGRITKQDVLGAAGAGQRSSATSGSPAPSPAREAPRRPAQPPPQQAPQPASGQEEVVQVGAMRKAIAEHMVTSANETARAWNMIEVDLSRVARMRAQAGPAFKEREGFSLTWMPFVSKALTQALLRFPNLNSTWNGDGTITRKRYVNLGIAVALENGLIVPVVKGAETMNLMGLARAVRDVAGPAQRSCLPTTSRAAPSRSPTRAVSARFSPCRSSTAVRRRFSPSTPSSSGRWW